MQTLRTLVDSLSVAVILYILELSLFAECRGLTTAQLNKNVGFADMGLGVLWLCFYLLLRKKQDELA